MRIRKSNLLSGVWCLFLLTLGCGPTSEPSLVDALKAPEGDWISAVEQLEVDVRQGSPSGESVISAKILKVVADKGAIRRFVELMTRVDKERHFANHPISVGNVVLRVKLKEGFYIVYCEVLELQGLQYCSLRVGAKNETNINNMKSFESKELVNWFSTNEIKPH